MKGTGYVVDSLEAALWAFQSTDSFEAAVLAAANLGDDADTTAAICGQIAGAFYGECGIPARWLDKLAMRDFIAGLAVTLSAPRGAETR
jgi:ADP-ribosyl-[dinitrogen reductase] hydrolase